MNAWEQPGLTAEERARVVSGALGFDFTEAEEFILIPAIRAAEASAVARERERCAGVARAREQENDKRAAEMHAAESHALGGYFEELANEAAEIATRINQGEK